MKRNIKTIGYGFVTLIVLGVVLSFSSFGKIFAAQTGGNNGTGGATGIPGIIHRGGGHQVIWGSVGLSELINGVSFDAVSPTNKPAVFEKPQGTGNFISSFKTAPKANKASSGNQQQTQTSQSFLSSLGVSWVGGDVFIGVPRDPSGNAGFTYHGVFSANNPWNKTFTPFGAASFTAPLQKVNVWRSVGIQGATNSSDGNVLATNLIHTTQNDQVCVNKEGSLVMCGSFSCTGNTPDSHAVMCQGDNTGLTADTPKTLVQDCTDGTKCEFVCMSGYHYDNGTCVADTTYHWGWGSWSNCITTGTCSGGTYTVDAAGTCTGSAQHCTITWNSTAVNGYDQDCDESCYDQYSETSCNNFIGDDGSTCTWTPTKVDWNGDAMEWNIGQNYVVDSNPNTTSGCPQGTNYAYTSGTAPLYTYYVTCSNGNCQWNRIEESVECNMGSSGSCTYSCESTTTPNIADAYGSVTTSYQCSNVHNSSICTDHGCTWTSNSHKIRSAICLDQNDNHVLDTYCDANTKPSDEVQSCQSQQTQSGQQAVDGQCGSAAGQTYSTTPSSNLCSAGYASLVILTNAGYSWNCQGINGGSNQSCGAYHSS